MVPIANKVNWMIKFTWELAGSWGVRQLPPFWCLHRGDAADRSIRDRRCCKCGRTPPRWWCYRCSDVTVALGQSMHLPHDPLNSKIRCKNSLFIYLCFPLPSLPSLLLLLLLLPLTIFCLWQLLQCFLRLGSLWWITDRFWGYLEVIDDAIHDPGFHQLSSVTGTTHTQLLHNTNDETPVLFPNNALGANQSCSHQRT